MSLVPAGTAAGAEPKPDVEAALYAELQSKGTAGFMVYLTGQADLSGAAKLADSDAKATLVYRELVAYAERTQADLKAALDARKATYRTYWIANAIYVVGDRPLVDAIATRSDIRAIELSKTYPLIDPLKATTADAGVDAVEWNINNIEAPRVWSEFGVRGEGIVVANIDTGVQYTHPALVGAYRGNLGGGQFDHNYSWFDPARICGNPSLAPCDNNGHGSHTMGTMAGDDGGANQIGVAPEVRWMAAKGCEAAAPPFFNECTDASLLSSAQFVLAPTDLNGQNPRPDLHADIVNNSWGGPGDDLWYQQSVNAWLAAGMFPAFSNGNSGPSCNTAGSPGDYPQSYSAGMYDINNVIANLSSRGPGVGTEIKPNIAAPGVNVRSSVPNNAYALGTGTSMASPHVAATVALIWSAAPTVKGDIPATRALLDQSATDVDSTGCGGTVADNNVFGEGRLNAYQAVLAAPRGPAGTVSGVVTDAATGTPLSGATVSSGNISATTGADGRYSIRLSTGEHTVTASRFGYVTQSVTVTIPENASVTQNFALVAAPLVTVSGRVTDGSGKGFPLYAKIEIAGRPGGPVFTNPVNGRYTVQLPASATYRFTTTAQYPGYQVVVQDVVVGAANKTHNIAVPISASACTAPGYRLSTVLTERFTAPTTPTGWSVVRLPKPTVGEWRFDDPGERGNLTGGTGGFAIMDSDDAGIGTVQDTVLVTPPLDFSGATAPHLRFNSDFRSNGGDMVDVDVSTDGGATWTNVWHQTADRRGPRIEDVALAPAAGSAAALVRFHYRGTWDWWWQVDNVELAPSATDPPILRETFDAPTTPAGWTVEKASEPTVGEWTFNDPGQRGNLTGGDGNFAIVDSDQIGSGNEQDTVLITPPVDLTGGAAPLLRFNSDFRSNGGDMVDVDVSTDGGATWTNVWHQTASRRGPRVEDVSLTAAAGSAAALIRFRYRGTWDWWWQVDNVEVLRDAGSSCLPVPGGLVVGLTTDRNTGAGLVGATVTSNANPAEKGVSVATPDDPNLGDGFYWLFSSAVGTQSFTASKAPYVSQTKSVAVVDNGTKQLNFALAAPRVTVAPAALEAHVPYGESRSTTVTVTNTGTASAQVQIVERPGSFEILDVSDMVEDVGWLATAPVSFTLGAGASRSVRVTLSATLAAGIEQPGKYTAQLGVETVSPYASPVVDVAMHAAPPPTWGKIQGTVIGQPCTGASTPIPAFVRIQLANNPEIGQNIRADAAGKFGWWVPAGRYQVIVSKDDWTAQTRVTTLDAGFVNTLDVTLKPFAGCS